MSLFGTSPTDDDNRPSEGLASPSKKLSSKGGLFDDEPSRSSSAGLFDNDDGDTDSPWSLPSPRKQQSRAQIVRNLLPSSDVPDSYIETFDTIAKGNANVSSDDIAKVFAAASLHEQAKQTRIVSLVAPEADGDNIQLGRAEFNVLLVLVALAQENETISLDSVDERRKNLPLPKLAGLTAEPELHPVEEIDAKPPQTPPKQHEPRTTTHRHPQSNSPVREFRPAAMNDPEDDPWNTPDMHKNHNHSGLKPNGPETNGHNTFGPAPAPSMSAPDLSQVPTETPGSNIGRETVSSTGSGWGGYFDGSGDNAAPGFNQATQDHVASPFGGNPVVGPSASAPTLGGDVSSRAPVGNQSFPPARTPGGRTGSSVEETILVTLMPEKEGLFMFQHHNYEVASQRRGSKVIRRYSDFVWLLDCLHKRYPFRVLPLLPPKRVAVNGNHLSNDGAFIEKRRRGLARFLNALVRHPVLSQEQLVVMFLTVPTELAVWRKQATISVQDEFTDRVLPPGLEESLPTTLEELFIRTRSGVRRSAELYINVCNILDRLVKRQEGVAADHGRVAMMLTNMIETSEDTYATDNNEVPLLNDGLNAMSNHLRTCQSLLEDESRGWDEGVLEDVKRQRDSLVSLRELFERRERLDKDNIPYLERRIQANETKLAGLRSKPEGTVKAGEVERVAESIIKDKESIVQQHNRSIFVKECIRDELVTFQSTQYHISRWNQDWAGERVKYAEMLADNWRRLLDELEGMPLGE